MSRDLDMAPACPATFACLVGDIGGTNARFAIAGITGAAVTLAMPQSFECADFPTPEAAIDHYLLQTRQARPDTAVLAFAGPVDNGAAKSTNGFWTLSETSLHGHGFSRTRVINDYTALALAGPRLQPNDLGIIGPDLPRSPDETLVVLGAGTGFGMGALARAAGRAIPVVTEGGHIAFAPTDGFEVDILRLLTERFGRVSVERILSGPGLSDLLWAVGRIHGQDPARMPAADIVAAGLSGLDPICVQTLERFCAIYGSVAGDFALAFGAKGGVLIGGGIAPRITSFLQASSFRERFEDKGRFRPYMAGIPTEVILHPYAALIGAAAAVEA